MPTRYALSVAFADAETPRPLSGRYVLEAAPLPPASLQVFRNGLLLTLGTDYLLTGQLISPLGQGWTDDDAVLCFYRC